MFIPTNPIKVSILDEFVDNLDKKFPKVMDAKTAWVQNLGNMLILSPIYTNSLPDGERIYFEEVTAIGDNLGIVDELIDKIHRYIGDKLDNHILTGKVLIWRVRPEISRRFNHDTMKVYYTGYSRLAVVN